MDGWMDGWMDIFKWLLLLLLEPLCISHLRISFPAWRRLRHARAHSSSDDPTNSFYTNVTEMVGRVAVSKSAQKKTHPLYHQLATYCSAGLTTAWLDPMFIWLTGRLVGQGKKSLVRCKSHFWQRRSAAVKDTLRTTDSAGRFEDDLPVRWAED